MKPMREIFFASTPGDESACQTCRF